jgi:heat shock protein HslJ
MTRHIAVPSTAQASRIPARLLCAASAILLLLGAAPPPAVLGQADAEQLLWEWQLLEVRDGGQLTPVPPGIGIRALLFADTITVEGACSSARGDFSLQAESITIAPLDIEWRGCDDATRAIDEHFYAGLEQTSAWAASGCSGGRGCRPSVLTFADVVGEPVMTLTSASLPADPGLSRWTLSRIGAADGSIAPVITGVEPWVEFQRGGHVVGDSGCGAFLGAFTTNGSTISVSDVATAAPDCTEALGDQAETIVSSLGEITDFEVLPAGLVLKDDAGLTRLAFVPAIDLPNRTWTPFEVLRDGEVLEEISGRLSTSAVRFAGQNADGRSYCRGFTGRSLSSGLALSVSELTPDTSFPCPKGKKEETSSAQEVEDAYLQALGSTASHALRGDELVLMDVDGQTVLRLSPQAELAGPTWVLTEMDVRPNAAKGKLREPVGDQPITAVFSDVRIGVLQGSTGVRQYDADYATPAGGVIRIEDATAFGPGCPRRSRDPVCVQERRYLELLSLADAIVVRPEEMRLHKGNRPILRFVPEESIVAEEPAEADAAAEG